MGMCMSKKGVDAKPQKRPISKATSAKTAKSPHKVRVASEEFKELAKRMKVLKSTCVSQMELVTRYDANYKAVFAKIHQDADDMASKHYPDTDEFKAYAVGVADLTRSLAEDHQNTMAADQPVKLMAEQYRKFLAEITGVESQFKLIEKEEKAFHSETKRLAKLESAKAQDKKKIEASKSSLLIIRNRLESMENDVILRMKATDAKAEPVLRAGHIAMYLGLGQLTDSLTTKTQAVVKDAKKVQADFISLDGEPRIVEVPGNASGVSAAAAAAAAEKAKLIDTPGVAAPPQVKKVPASAPPAPAVLPAPAAPAIIPSAPPLKASVIPDKATRTTPSRVPA